MGSPKEIISFWALGFMIVAAVLITFARRRTNRVVRLVLSAVAFLLFICAIPLILITIS